jgi:hypothetical protein
MGRAGARRAAFGLIQPHRQSGKVSDMVNLHLAGNPGTVRCLSIDSTHVRRGVGTVSTRPVKR